MNFRKHPWMTAMSIALFAFPFTVSAATLQQKLDQAVKFIETLRPQRLNQAMDLRIVLDNLSNSKNLKNADHTEIGVKYLISTRLVSDKPGAKAYEGQLIVQELRFATRGGDEAVQEVIKRSMLPGMKDGVLKDPVTIQWKYTNQKLYVRVEKLNSVISAFYAAMGAGDLNKVVGQWVSFDVDEKQLQGILKSSKDSSLLTATFQKLSIFRIAGIEKRAKNEKGQLISRLRVQLNPSVLTELEKMMLKDVTNFDPSRVEKTQRIRKTVALIRSAMNQLRVTVTLNEATGRVERAEAKGIVKMTACQFNLSSTAKNPCTSRGRIQFGFSSISAYLPDSGAAVAIPKSSMTAQEFMKMLQGTPSAPPELIGGPVKALRVFHVRGPETAKVTLIEYSDFECPYCQKFNDTLKQVLAAHPNDVRLVYRHFPLSFHPEAQDAAKATECATDQQGNEGFWQMHDAIFQEAATNGLTSSTFTILASKQGLSSEKFEACMKGTAYNDFIDAQQKAGTDLGVNGTPTTFVNGKLIVGAVSFEELDAAVVEALAK